MLIEYRKNGDINIETVIKVRDAYQQSLKSLDTHQRQEINDKSSALMQSIGKCYRLKENEQSKQPGRVR